MSKMTTKCPYCGKELPTISLNKTSFCNLMCEKNYRYRQKHMDPITGDYPDRKNIEKL